MSGAVIDAVLLAVMLAIIVRLALRGPRGYRLLAEADTAARAIYYRRIFVAQLVLLTLPPIVALLVLGRIDAVGAMPVELWPASALLRYGEPAVEPDMILQWLVIGIAVAGVPLGAALTWRRTRQGKGPPKSIARIVALIPRNRTEVAYGCGIALAAGVGEELFFRLVLPVLLTAFIGSVPAVAIAIVLFGAGHLYQGWKGMLTTGVVGFVQAFLYLSSGSLLIPIVMHVLIDMMVLVVRPVVRGAWKPAAD